MKSGEPRAMLLRATDKEPCPRKPVKSQAVLAICRRLRALRATMTDPELRLLLAEAERNLRNLLDELRRLE